VLSAAEAYEPEPCAAFAQVKVEAVAAVEEIAGVPGTALLEVAKDPAGAEVTRARTTTVSPIAVPEGSVNVTV